MPVEKNKSWKCCCVAAAANDWSLKSTSTTSTLTVPRNGDLSSPMLRATDGGVPSGSMWPGTIRPSLKPTPGWRRSVTISSMPRGAARRIFSIAFFIFSRNFGAGATQQRSPSSDSALAAYISRMPSISVKSSSEIVPAESARDLLFDIRTSNQVLVASACPIAR